MIEQCAMCREWRKKYCELLVEKVRAAQLAERAVTEADENRLSLRESERMELEMTKMQEKIKELQEKLDRLMVQWVAGGRK